MMNLNVPLNPVSFGQVSICILKELFRRDEKVNVFPIGQPNLEAYSIAPDFGGWLQESINRAPAKYKNSDNTLKLWHIQQAWDQIGKHQSLLTFHETDGLTEIEANVLAQQEHVFVTNSYSKKVFENFGLENVILCPLGFDSETFYPTGATYLDSDVIVWNLMGKLESRKNTLQVLKLWSEKYGNNRNHRLNCLIHNPFIDPNQQQQVINQTLGKPFYNITFLPALRENSLVNDTLNCCDISLSLSSAEGYDLPCINALGLGKTVVGSNCTAHKDYLNESNSILVEPAGKRVAADGVFFHQNAPFNSGNWDNITNEAILEGFMKAEQSISVVDGKKVSKFHDEAVKIKDQFNYSKMVDILLKNLQ